jgi:hypothetical protein
MEQRWRATQRNLDINPRSRHSKLEDLGFARCINGDIHLRTAH